tara:strand:+ start:1049 stop:2764 length:1716 start_codon:yes stop_codon:yes gene_type:complete
MADTTGLSPFMFPVSGGLILNKSNFLVPPGAALELENFEPDTTGGYRRINGYEKWASAIVPFTSSSTEPVLMSAVYGTEIIAARGESVYRCTDAANTLSSPLTDIVAIVTVASTTGFSATGTLLINEEQITYTAVTPTTFTGCTRGANGTSAVSHLAGAAANQTWTSIDSGRSDALKYTFRRLNFSGAELLLFADGANNASYWDGSTVTDISSTNAPADPHFVSVFKNTGFYAGTTSNPQEVVFAAPLTLDNFSVAEGAGSFVIDSPVTGMIVFRDSLFIFSANRIYKLVGSSQADYQLAPITREIGCRNGWTIKEFAGDVVFLGPDGLRTIAGTTKIGDVDLGTISKQVQELFQNRVDIGSFDAVVIPTKTQYRLIFNSEGTTAATTTGVICVRSQEGYEFATTRGLRTSCSDSEVYNGDFFVVHGSYDGYVYRDEKGATFDGTNIIGRYRSPDLTANDPGLRKAFQRIIINYAPEGAVNADLFLRYDYENPSAPRPPAYPFDSTQVVALYGTSTYGTATYGGQTDPLIRQPVEGSGFSVALRVVDSGVGVSQPYSLKGFQLEFTTAARR